MEDKRCVTVACRRCPTYQEIYDLGNMNYGETTVEINLLYIPITERRDVWHLGLTKNLEFDQQNWRANCYEW